MFFFFVAKRSLSSVDRIIFNKAEKQVFLLFLIFEQIKNDTREAFFFRRGICLLIVLIIIFCMCDFICDFYCHWVVKFAGIAARSGIVLLQTCN